MSLRVEEEAGTRCPALDAAASWDKLEFLRGPILGLPHLVDHARALAGAHGLPSVRGRTDLVVSRLRHTRLQLEQAYAVLSREVRALREPTPAEEWLLDNAHIVEDQLREVSVDLPRGYLAKLPRLTGGALRGAPRVYALCLDYLRHTDARVETESLIAYVTSYQSVHPLCIGELWAVPIMLRIGLLMIVATVATEAAQDKSAQEATQFAEKLKSSADPQALLGRLAQKELSAPFLVELKRVILEQETDSGAVLDWIGQRALSLGSSAEEMSRVQHLRRAEDQLTVGNAITSMRTISAYEWAKFFERTSLVEEVLLSDPARVYAHSDAATRDRMRHTVERIARSNSLDERDVARAAVRLAERAQPQLDADPARGHVGYYLVDRGRKELERELSARPPWRDFVVRVLESHGSAYYFGGVLLGTLLLEGLLYRWLTELGVSGLTRAFILALVCISVSEVALGLMNSLVMALLPPRVLSKLEFKQGIPAEHTTLVVVPTLLDSPDAVARLLADLEIRALANMEQHLHFALLTDFCDAPEGRLAQDEPLLEQALTGIASLNARHPREHAPRFMLLHRGRVYNAAESCFMGWERKRGKLEELNRLLLGATDTTFAVVTCPAAILSQVRYVITLDSDTELPRGSARKLVAAMAHPLNRPRFDTREGRVVAGYGIIQPRVGVVPTSSRRSRFARISAGVPGIDPYTTAVSDVYQDLFAEGSFVGKGIYDVRAFSQALHGLVPENTLLSHDLFEGLFARAALASDIEVFDDQPASYTVEARRQHRWIRGDFQLLPWLLGLVKNRARLPWFSRWKIVDNLRRAMLAPTLIAALLLAVALAPRAAVLVVTLMLAVTLSSVLVRLFANLVRKQDERSLLRWPLLWGDLKTNSLRAALSLTFMLDSAILAVDAMTRTLYRLLISRKHLLQWTATGQAERLSREKGLRIELRLLAGALGALSLALFIGFAAPVALLSVLPLCALWAGSPLLASWLSRELPGRFDKAVLSDRDRAYARRVARKTWRFFETFVSAEENWLPPDNYQEDPRGVVAHRTSPTNIGLYLLSCLSARDLGYLTLRELFDRLAATLDTMERLETHRGHLLNWYDTTTLRPLPPKYVSMVDSGNLLGHLWTLRQGCFELAQTRLGISTCLDAVQDALLLAGEGGAAVDTLLTRVAQARSDSDDGSIASSLRALEALAAFLPLVPEQDRVQDDASYWLSEARTAAVSWLEELEGLAPFGTLLGKLPPRLTEDEEVKASTRLLATQSSLEGLLHAAEQVLPALRARAQRADAEAGDAAYLSELVRLVERSCEAIEPLRSRMLREAARAGSLADRMDFSFMYDEDRLLFSIGYNVELGRLDSSRYDLLASEARLGSFAAIAKGDVPQEHWFHLSRARVRSHSRAVLVAWSGSMFEYLMPLLVMKRCENTLLDETYGSVVLAQRAHAEAQGVPWGISESAYNVMDLHMTYQYRAFGVQALGLKAGLADDLVIAPYATMLSVMVQPEASLANLRRLAKEGLEGPCGFYESVDYTPERVPPGRRCVVVKAYMAHHQGMALVALANVLQDSPMQRRFHADARVKATELLLEERAPIGVPATSERVIRSPAQALSDEELSHVERVSLSDLPAQRCHLLGHGELATLIGTRGIGFTTWRELDVHRYREDKEIGSSGVFLYVRNRKDGQFWSAGFEPTRKPADEYFVEFSPDKVRIQRRDGDVETIVEIAVSPEFPAEVRRISLLNHGSEALELDLTSYMEVVLAPRAADLAHRAFSNMFVHTEAVPERGAVLATRRPRKRAGFQPWCLQMLTPEGDLGETPFEWETSRVEFLGRGHGYDAPRAMKSLALLSGSVGCVLDPIIALRRSVVLQPGERKRLTLTTALSDSKAGVLGVADALSPTSGITRTFELAWADARVKLKHLGISGLVSHRFQRLLSALLFPEPALRAHGERQESGLPGTRVLWSLGISGDLPILLVRLDDLELTDLVRDVLLAHEFYRLNNVQVDLLLWDEEPAGYLSPVHDKALQAVRATASQGRVDQRGGVFLRHASRLSPTEQALVLSAAKVVLSVSKGSLARQLRNANAKLREEVKPSALVRALVPHAAAPESSAPLSFGNGIGGFSEGGREYVLRLAPGERPPLPWCNVMAHASFGTVVSEGGGGFTWACNSQRHRLTPWSNDPVLDPVGEALYLKDDADGSIWSATPSPAPNGATYTVRHGQGYSKFERESTDLSSELTIFLAPDQPAKVYRLRLWNRSSRARTVSVYMFVDWALGATRDQARDTVNTEFVPAANTIIAENAFSAFPARCALLTSSRKVASFSGDRSELLGLSGSRVRPAGLEQARLSGAMGAGLNPCAALHVIVTVPAGSDESCVFVLADAPSRSEASAASVRYAGERAWDALFEQTRNTWNELLEQVVVKTPDPALDIMVNRWLLYQTLSCRIWGRSGFYQSGGAYGYRDQLQDVLALLHARPEIAREHLLKAAARQFKEGDVQHWWHPETGEGVRTHCSDDMLWLPFAVAHYVRVTGDAGVLESQVSFLDERGLAPNEHDLYSVPRVSEERATLYEHCRRALLVATTQGAHGLPLMGGGDWNDGMDQVGAEGKGESVWLGWFLARVWKDFAVLARARGDFETAERARVETIRLSEALDTHAWDGAWYRRAFFDDGSLIGSQQSEECRIDAIAQSWSALSGVANAQRAQQALQSALEHLVKPDPGMMLLLTPAFAGKGSADPGYICAYPEGIRENGGQYTHGVLWTVQALLAQGECDRAHALLSMLNPIRHGSSPEDVARSKVEPYVVVADVYSNAQHYGRGGWTWYTGAAGWMYRIAVEDMLGLDVRGQHLCLRPRVPSTWTEFSIDYKRGDTRFCIRFDNGQGIDLNHAELVVLLDQQPVPANRIPLAADGKTHLIQVTVRALATRGNAGERPSIRG